MLETLGLCHRQSVHLEMLTGSFRNREYLGCLAITLLTEKYGELLIMPADSRWDLTRTLLTWKIW